MSWRMMSGRCIGAVGLGSLLVMACRATPTPTEAPSEVVAASLPTAAPSTPSGPKVSPSAPNAASSTVTLAEQPSPSPAASAQAQHFTVAGHELSLSAAPGPCTVSHRAPSGAASTVTLGLSGPCYIMPWKTLPPKERIPGGDSDGVPVGTKGDARAYSYGNGATVVLVIGNPIPPEQVERARGYTCAGGSQGLVLQGANAFASKRIVARSGRPECIEWGGPDEQDYWLFAHD